MFVLTDMQKVGLAIQPVDGAGNPAKIDAAPVWDVIGANPEILTVTASDDGLSAEVVTVGPLGTAQVRVVADADLGMGVKPITGILDVEVIASEAVAVVVNAGEPEDR